VTELSLYRWLFEGFAFVLGAVIGSFLNVCIYRMPLDLSVNEPKRSFCPHCKKPIPWSRNIPLVSWVLLRGRCAECREPISFRYFGVELLTALAFLAVWVKCQPPGEWTLALPYWILLSLLIVGTFIDFEHFIIPNEITWGGVGAGVVLSFLAPRLMDTDSRLASLALSLAGAATGYVLLWLVVEAGKILFGKRHVAFEKEEVFMWVRQGDDAELRVGDDMLKWSDVFSRHSDRLQMKCPEARVGGAIFTDALVVMSYDSIRVKGMRAAQTVPVSSEIAAVASETGPPKGAESIEEIEMELDDLDEISGKVTEVVIPREAMGYGDVKFIAAIGAFLGWKAVLFAVVSGSVFGAVIGITAIVARRREWSAKIPFGPYLALGAVVWLFAGPAIVAWYFGIISPPEL
jgi:leader peptidase (prepilin peptidase)/N-methyltransferase